jgi:dihydrofolate reductase
MTKIRAGITTSLDGYITGPDDGPGKGLGEGGEALHTWVFGAPWTYDSGGPKGEATGVDKEYLETENAKQGAVIAGRNTYEAADHWGDKNPWEIPVFIVTHQPQDQPPGDEFTFVGSLDEALERARAAAGDKDVHVMGGANTIRQALAAGAVDELSIVVAPIVLGGGKRLFEGFDHRIELEQRGVRQSEFATFIDYRVKRA